MLLPCSYQKKEKREEIGYKVAVKTPLSLFGGCNKQTQSRKKGGGGTQGCQEKEPVAEKKIKTTKERLRINAIEEQSTTERVQIDKDFDKN